MIRASEVSCVVVTRGNVNLAEVLSSLPFEDVVVWDNAQLAAEDLDEKVYGRYVGAAAAKHPVIAVQDDDAVVEDWPAILQAYDPGAVTCNMGAAHRRYYEPMNLALVGFGAIFDKSLVTPTFDRYFAHFPKDELFVRECDRVFTGLNPLQVVSVPYRSLGHEETTARMWRESRHGGDLWEIRQRIRAVARGGQ